MKSTIKKPMAMILLVVMMAVLMMTGPMSFMAYGASPGDLSGTGEIPKVEDIKTDADYQNMTPEQKEKWEAQLVDVAEIKIAANKTGSFKVTIPAFKKDAKLVLAKEGILDITEAAGSGSVGAVKEIVAPVDVKAAQSLTLAGTGTGVVTKTVNTKGIKTGTTTLTITFTGGTGADIVKTVPVEVTVADNSGRPQIGGTTGGGGVSPSPNFVNGATQSGSGAGTGTGSTGAGGTGGVGGSGSYNPSTGAKDIVSVSAAFAVVSMAAAAFVSSRKNRK